MHVACHNMSQIYEMKTVRPFWAEHFLYLFLILCSSEWLIHLYNIHCTLQSECYTYTMYIVHSRVTVTLVQSTLYTPEWLLHLYNVSLYTSEWLLHLFNVHCTIQSDCYTCTMYIVHSRVNVTLVCTLYTKGWLLHLYNVHCTLQSDCYTCTATAYIVHFRVTGILVQYTL